MNAAMEELKKKFEQMNIKGSAPAQKKKQQLKGNSEGFAQAKLMLEKHMGGKQPVSSTSSQTKKQQLVGNKSNFDENKKLLQDKLGGKPTTSKNLTPPPPPLPSGLNLPLPPPPPSLPPSLTLPPPPSLPANLNLPLPPPPSLPTFLPPPPPIIPNLSKTQLQKSPVKESPIPKFPTQHSQQQKNQKPSIIPSPVKEKQLQGKNNKVQSSSNDLVVQLKKPINNNKPTDQGQIPSFNQSTTNVKAQNITFKPIINNENVGAYRKTIFQPKPKQGSTLSQQLFGVNVAGYFKNLLMSKSHILQNIQKFESKKTYDFNFPSIVQQIKQSRHDNFVLFFDHQADVVSSYTQYYQNKVNQIIAQNQSKCIQAFKKKNKIDPKTNAVSLDWSLDDPKIKQLKDLKDSLIQFIQPAQYTQLQYGKIKKTMIKLNNIIKKYERQQQYIKCQEYKNINDKLQKLASSFWAESEKRRIEIKKQIQDIIDQTAKV